MPDVVRRPQFQDLSAALPCPTGPRRSPSCRADQPNRWGPTPCTWTAGVPVFLDTTHVTAVDQGWVVSSLRQAMLAQGVLLRPKAEQAQWIVEARVGVYGTDSNSLLVGIPQLSVPPTFTGVPTGTIPEIPLIKKSDQQATSKL